MKHPSIRVLTTCALAAMAVSAYELTSSTPAESSPDAQRSSSESDSNREQRMIRQQEKIMKRLGFSAPLDATETTDPATGIDEIQRLYDLGFIIPATVEEVEATLQAAASTPDTEDDKAALGLKHRGSYRFFLND